MTRRTSATRILAVAVSILTFVSSMPFSLADSTAIASMGMIVTQGTVTIGNIQALTGTTIFSGDKIAVTDLPALITLDSGGRIEMTKAVATLSSEGNTIVVHPFEGLFRFSFVKGEHVRIDAGRYIFEAVGKNSAHAGGLGLDRNGLVALVMREGALVSVDKRSGLKKEISPGNPLQVTLIEGVGDFDGKNFTDKSKTYVLDALSGKCVVVRGDAYRIESNTDKVVTIDRSAKSGTFDYMITDCNKEALQTAGASDKSIDRVLPKEGGSTSDVGGLGMWEILAIAAGGAAGAAVAIGVSSSEKSPSSR